MLQRQRALRTGAGFRSLTEAIDTTVPAVSGVPTAFPCDEQGTSARTTDAFLILQRTEHGPGLEVAMGLKRSMPPSRPTHIVSQSRVRIGAQRGQSLYSVDAPITLFHGEVE